MVNPNKLAPKTPAQALRRRIGAVTVAGLSLLGGAKTVDAVFLPDNHEPHPTTTVTVEAGDTGVVWNEASKVAAANNVDPRDVVEQIQANSPDLADGIAHPGDVLNVPMTDEQIAQQESAVQENNG